MPTPKQYENATERQRAFRARRRQERLEAEEAERRDQREARRQEAEAQERHTLLRQRMGENLQAASRMWHFPQHYEGLGGVSGAERDEMREYAKRLGEALASGNTHLPR